MTELVRQYAIRLPDGSLLTEPDHTPAWVRMFSTRGEPRTAIFDDEGAATETLDSLRTSARQIGVVNIGASVVSRVAAFGPWGDSDFAPAIEEIERHVNGTTT